jgi:chemotaxis signal transduction protein
MADSTPRRLLVWRVGGMCCAAPIERLREILPGLPVARIPGVHPAVRGVANVRGALVTVVDGRTVLGFPDAEEPGATLLVEVGPRTVGLAVDEVEDLIQGDGADSREGGRWHPAQPVRVLDLEELLQPLFGD